MSIIPKEVFANLPDELPQREHRASVSELLDQMEAWLGRYASYVLDPSFEEPIAWCKKIREEHYRVIREIRASGLEEGEARIILSDHEMGR